MGFLADVQQGMRELRPQECLLANSVRESIPQKEQSEVFAAIDNKSLSSSVVSKLLLKRGVLGGSKTSVLNHRKRECACGKQKG